nr:hypothetical protein [Sicyoidochytrium minutum DNA virus]
MVSKKKRDLPEITPVPFLKAFKDKVKKKKKKKIRDESEGVEDVRHERHDKMAEELERNRKEEVKPVDLSMGLTDKITGKIKDKTSSKIKKYKRLLLPFAVLVVAAVFAIVAFASRRSSSDTAEEKPKKEKKTGGFFSGSKKEREKRIRFEENRAQIEDGEERQKQALKAEYNAVVVQIAALEKRAEQNQLEAQRNSEKYRQLYSESPSVTPGPHQSNRAGSLTNAFKTPTQLSQEKENMVRLSDELKEEMKDIREEHNELTMKAQQLAEQYNFSIAQNPQQ